MLKSKYIRRIVIAAGLLVCLSGCDDPYKDEGFKAYDTLPAATWLSERPEYSEFVAIMQKADLFNALNSSLFDQTLFVTDNAAVNRYLRDVLGLTSVSQMTKSQAMDLIQYHVIPNNKMKASNMYNKIPHLTASKDYLTAGIDESTERRYISNIGDYPDAFFVQNDIEVNNGYIQVLDNVLIPLTESLWQVLDGEGSGYKIFADAIKNLYVDVEDNTIPEGSRTIDTLRMFLDRNFKMVKETEIRDYKTVMAVPDEVYNTYGITDYRGLYEFLDESDYNTNLDPEGKLITDTISDIYQYFAYHIFYHAWGYDEFATFPKDMYNWPYANSIDEMIKYPISTRRGYGVKDSINSLWFNSHVRETEPGVTFRITEADITAKNGFIHKIDNLGLIPSHQAYYVIEWELTDLIDFTAIPFYRRDAQEGQGAEKYYLSEGEIDGVKWESIPKSVAQVWYHSEYLGVTTPGRYLYQDAFYFNLGAIGWLSIDGPVMSAGTYQIKVEKSNDPDKGGKIRINWGYKNLGNDRNFQGGDELATWGDIVFASEESGLPMIFTVSLAAGEVGIDRFVFLPDHYKF